MRTVLIIDDETATLTMFRLFLKAYGYSVLTAANGETGLQLAREHLPGIVFTDLKMPSMPGTEAIEALTDEDAERTALEVKRLVRAIDRATDRAQSVAVALRVNIAGVDLGKEVSITVGTPVVLSIHNLAYQGVFPSGAIEAIGGELTEKACDAIA